MNELIALKTLPVITQQLEAKSQEIKKKTAEYLSMICNNETVKIIKAARAELNNEKKDLESQRIAMKNKYMAEYETFLKVYKTLITDIYDDTDNQLKIKIDAVEDEIKAMHEAEVRSFFEEYIADYPQIDFLPFERLGLNITKTVLVEKLKNECKAFIHMVADDLEMISTQPDQAEILVEYIQSLNATQAITSVAAKHKAIEVQKAQIEAQRQVYEPIPGPIPEEEPDFESLQKVAFVNFKSGHPEGGFGGQDYSYLIPDGFEYFAGQVLEVETKGGITEAQIQRFGTTNDVPARIIPYLKYLPEPDTFKVPDFSQFDFGLEETNERINATIRIAVSDTVERIDELINLLGKMGYHYDEI
jgi:predicted small secreted protein